MAYTAEELSGAGINPEKLTVVDHPLMDHYMTIVRDRETNHKNFNTLVRKTIAPMLAYEATRGIGTSFHRVETPTNTHYDGVEVRNNPLVVTIPRAGLALVDAFSDVLPGIELGYVNVRRDEATAQPVVGEVRLPSNCALDEIFVVDPMLATGGSMNAAVEALLRRGARPENITTVSMIAAFAGVAAVHSVSPEIHVVSGALDAELNEHSYIIPGLGDAGDRLFGNGTAGVASTE